MNRKILFIFYLLPMVFLITGCDKFRGPAGPSLSGDLVGFSYLYDVNGVRSADDSGIAVSAEGTSLKTTTSSDGRWDLTGLTTGTYTLDFTKTGYGLYKRIGLQFVGGGQAYFGSESLYQIPAFTVTNLSDSISNGDVFLSGKLTGILPENLRYVICFVGDSSGVSSDPKTYAFATDEGASAGYSPFPILTENTFNSYGITSGQTVYIVAYACGYGGDSYTDLSTGNTVYPCINPIPSNVITLVVP